MQIKLFDVQCNVQKPVVFDEFHTINNHVLLVGTTGTGKSRYLRTLLMKQYMPEAQKLPLPLHKLLRKSC